MAVLKEYKLSRQVEQYITTYASCTPVSVGYDHDRDLIITLSVDEESDNAQYKVFVVFPGGEVPPKAENATYVGALPLKDGNAHVYFSFNQFNTTKHGNSDRSRKSSTIKFNSDLGNVQGPS